MAVLLIPPYLQFFDANGDPLSLGKVYTYAAGTNTPKATFTDNTSNTQAANPVVLDSAGRTAMWGSGSYKFVVYDANDNLVRTTDNVASYTTIESEADTYFQAFSGTGSQTAFTLSTNLGTDENAIMVYVSDGLEQHVTNGTFATDTAWTKGAGWTIGSGVATATGAISTALSQTSAVTLIEGQSYNLIYTVTRSAGGIIPSIGGTNGTERTANGTYRETIIAGSTQTIAFTGNAFTGTVDTITITPSDFKGYDIQAPTSYTLSGTTLTFGTAPPIGTGNIYVFAPSALVAAASASADAADASATIATNNANATAADVITTNANVATTTANAATATTQANLAIAAASAALLSSGIVSVAQYTAGGTSDDTTLFQNAINAAVAAGKALFVPPATYTVTGLSITGSLLMYGVGESTIIKQKASTSGDMVAFTGNASQLYVRDLVMDGNQANQSAQSGNMLIRSTADGAASADSVVVCLENIEFRNPAYAAVSMEGDNATGTREILFGRNLRFRNGAEGVENVGTDYVPRDISLVDSVEVFLSDLDFDSDSAPTIGRSGIVIGQSQDASIRYTEGFITNVNMRRRGCNVSQGLGAVDFYIWAKNFTLSNAIIKNSAFAGLKWKGNCQNLSFLNVTVDGTPANIAAVAGNASTTADSGDILTIDGLRVLNTDYAANYAVIINGKVGSDYSAAMNIRNVTIQGLTGSGMVFYDCKNVNIENPEIIGGVVGLSLQSACDGLARIKGGRLIGQSSYALYLDNNEATFDYEWADTIVQDNSRTGSSVYVEGRHGAIRNIRFSNVDDMLLWGDHTTLILDDVAGTAINGDAGLTSNSATVTALHITDCYIPSSVATPITPGTFTSIVYAGNSFSIGQAQGQNLLINPSGAVYQRDVAATADDAYFADCWYILSQTGTVTPSRLTNPEDGYRNGVRITQSQVTAQRYGFAQIIEGQNCAFLRGNKVTFRPRVRASASQAIRYAIIGWTGTEDSVTSDFVNDWTSSTYTTGNFFISTTTTIIAVGASTPTANTWTNLPAINGSVGSTVNNLAVMVWTEGTAAQNFTLDFDFASLNQGVLPITFEQRTYDAEFQLCQRYLPTWSVTSAAVQSVALGQCISTSVAGVFFDFKTPTRIPVTAITLSANSDFALRDALGAASVVTAVSFGTASRDSAAANITGTGVPFVAGSATRLFSTASATAKILFTGAEL